jgi:hypothetical protein
MAQKLTFNTDQGIAQYPWLTKPDYAFDTAGQFKVNLKVSPEKAKDLMDECRSIAKKEFGDKANTARMPFKTDPETNEVVIITKSKFKPKIVDSTGHIIPEHATPQIYGGSQLKLAGTIFPYKQGGNVGISLQLAGVQIIELVSNPEGGSSVNFAPVEGGFVAANDNMSAANDNEAPTAGQQAEAGDSYNF